MRNRPARADFRKLAPRPAPWPWPLSRSPSSRASRAAASEQAARTARETRPSPWQADSMCLVQPRSPRARSASAATKCTRAADLFLARNACVTRRAATASPLSSRCAAQSATTGANSGADCRARVQVLPSPGACRRPRREPGRKQAAAQAAACRQPRPARRPRAAWPCRDLRQPGRAARAPPRPAPAAAGSAGRRVATVAAPHSRFSPAASPWSRVRNASTSARLHQGVRVGRWASKSLARPITDPHQAIERSRRQRAVQFLARRRAATLRRLVGPIAENSQPGQQHDAATAARYFHFPDFAAGRAEAWAAAPGPGKPSGLDRGRHGHHAPQPR